MILDDTLKERGFAAYVSLRDPTSGEDDNPLCGEDGYPRYLFMCINFHKFENTKEAEGFVKKQCQLLHDVSLFNHFN